LVNLARRGAESDERSESSRLPAGRQGGMVEFVPYEENAQSPTGKKLEPNVPRRTPALLGGYKREKWLRKEISILE
jgi:hypothetical protein